MPFLYPKLFPEFFDCVEETKSNPADIRLGDYQIYPVGMPLEKAMALIWKPKAFFVSGSAKYPIQCCGEEKDPIYSFWTFSGQTISLYPPTPQKMSELACNFNANYLHTSTRQNFDCSGNDSTETDEGEFTFGAYSTKIYLYNKMYYIPLFYAFAGGTNYNSEFGDRTYYYGNVSIDGVNFPLYVRPPECGEAIANITITTSAERDTS